MRAAYLAVLLAACAAPVPRQYAQGVPVAPRAPAFDPVFEAPTDTGHPGYVGPVENLPRSPYTRVLPQTPETRSEPGVWASDSPGIKSHPLLVFDEPIPFALSDDLDAVPMYECAEETQRAADKFPPLKATIAKLARGERMCLAVRALHACIGVRIDTFMWLHKEALEQPTAPGKVMWEGTSLRDTRDVLDVLKASTCEKNNSEAVEVLFKAWWKAMYGDAASGGRH